MPASLDNLPSPLQILLKLNLRLFPISPGKKSPAHKGWQQEASHGLGAQLEFWEKYQSQYNVGIATGCVTPRVSNEKPSVALLVLDFDRGKGGLAAFQTMVRDTTKLLPPTFTVHTRDGGYHLYYYFPSQLDLRNKANWKQGVDIRANGGYVVGPGSTVPADDPTNSACPGKYSITKDRPIAKAPVWLIKELYSPPVALLGKSHLT